MLKVLKTIRAPPPLDLVPDEPEDVETDAKKTKKKEPKQKGNRKNKRPKAKKPKKTVSKHTEKASRSDGQQPAGNCVYKAGDFQKQQEFFVDSQKESGYSHREALGLWKESAERTALLANMSVAERKRRRFT